MILDDVREFLEESVDELDVENINAAQYWVARMGFSEEEWSEFMNYHSNRYIRHILRSGNPREALKLAMGMGVVLGYLHGNRELMD